MRTPLTLQRAEIEVALSNPARTGGPCGRCAGEPWPSARTRSG
ncbi:hypothetical protein ACIBAI_17275 [Streptomyces sp. NPDC051041]